MRNQANDPQAPRFAYVADWSDKQLARVYASTVSAIDAVSARGEKLYDLPDLLQAVVTEQHRRAGRL